MAASHVVMVTNKVGLHARPAALFARTASTFSSTISIENITKSKEPVNAKSVLRVLSAGIEMNDHLRISAEGADENAAVEALCTLIYTNFGELE